MYLNKVSTKTIINTEIEFSSLFIEHILVWHSVRDFSGPILSLVYFSHLVLMVVISEKRKFAIPPNGKSTSLATLFIFQYHLLVQQSFLKLFFY